MGITITAFRQSPDGGRGLARDMPVRWALEEAGLAYAEQLLTFAELKEAEHLVRQPFGQIPTYSDGEVALFESGAIVLHIAERHGGLLPDDPAARSRAVGWMFAALSTVEPPIVERSMAMMLERDRPWFADRMARLDDAVRVRLSQLSARLGDAPWLEGEFSAGDLMMVSVLRRLSSSGLLDDYPTLAAYVARGEARPAWRRAFDAQYAVFLKAQAERAGQG